MFDLGRSGQKRPAWGWLICLDLKQVSHAATKLNNSFFLMLATINVSEPETQLVQTQGDMRV